MHAIVFLTAFFACQSKAPLSKDEPAPQAAPDIELVGTQAQGALTIPTQATIGSLNVHSSKYGIVYRDEDNCYADIETTSLTVPTAEEPETTQDLQCTPFMNDPAWQRCLLKEILQVSPSLCVCNAPGAPVEEGIETPCPTLMPAVKP